MDNSLIILRSDLNGGMHSGGSSATNQERLFHSSPLHFMSYVHHFIQRRCDQTAQPHDINPLLYRGVQYFICRYHYSKINHVITVTAQYNTHDVFSNIVNITL